MNTFRVFLGWSGDLSRAIATTLRDWLPDVIRNAEPWLSSEDLRKGQQWLPKLSESLSESVAGVVVLTRENVSSPWILFEAGALSKALPNRHCCTLLCDLRVPDVSGPLAQFQATTLEREDIYRLVRSLNAANTDENTDEARLKRWFDQSWSDLAAKLQRDLREKPPSETPSEPGPSDRDLLEEILVTLACSPKTDPGVMRVFGPAAAWPPPGQEALDETDKTQPRTDHRQAA